MTSQRFVVPSDCMLNLDMQVKRIIPEGNEDVLGPLIIATAHLDGPPQAVGAVLRALADQIDPPKKVTRRGGPIAPDTD